MSEPSTPGPTHILNAQKVSKATPSNLHSVPSNSASNALSSECTQNPLRHIQTGPLEPSHAIKDDPVLNGRQASWFLGISLDLLEKWRQRQQGPNYLQYGPGGPVLYELSALLAFKTTYRIQAKGQPRTRRSR